jgi:hypothetical protein
MRKLEASLADGRIIYDRQKARRIRHNRLIETQRLIVVGQIAEVCAAAGALSLTSGTRPTITKACLSDPLKAVDLFSAASDRRSTPRVLVLMFLPLCVPQSPPSTGCCHIRVNHLSWIDHTLEFSFRDKSQLQCRLFEREVVIHCVVSDLRRLVVADHRGERRHQHQ